MTSRSDAVMINPSRHYYRTIFLCFLAAMIEGADIVSVGLAAPKIGAQYGFGPGAMSLILTATIAGLMVGAIGGGYAGDRIGRKRAIVFAFAALAIFSIATAHMADLNGFIAIRFLCGLGIGGAFPNLIALASEASSEGRRSTGVGMMFCGTPLGGALLGLAASTQASSSDWGWIFYLGGVAPLLLLPALILFLPESKAFARWNEDFSSTPAPLLRMLFAEGRWLITLMLWVGYASTQILVYLLNNWLPTLMVSRGFSLAQASLISALENFGAAAGCVVLAMLADRGDKRLLLAVVFAGAAGGLASMAMLSSFGAVIFAGIVTGFFVIGGQLVLYTLAPAFYPAEVRAGGTGAAVSFGRLGGIAGPLLAGQLLAAGVSSAGVIFAAIPCALVAGMAASVAARERP